jgi:hypothetical protein
MSWLRRSVPWRSLAHRLVSGLVLVGYLAAVLGLPLPARAHKLVDQPFPCQDDPCGCQTAEQCWTACCCYTVEEHWAWARAHHIEPPDYATRPTDQGWDTKPKRDCEEGGSACSCCKAKHECEAKSERETTSKASIRWVSSAASLRCQGANALESTTAAVPPPPHLTWHPFPAVVGRFLPCDEFALSVPSPPGDPPPRSQSD